MANSSRLPQLTKQFVSGTRLHNNQSVSLLNTTATYFSVGISPDGNHLASGGDGQKVRIWSLQDVVHEPPDLENALTNVPGDVRAEEVDSQQGLDPPPQEAQDTQTLKDDDKGENVPQKDTPAGVETTSQNPSESASLRNSLDAEPRIHPTRRTLTSLRGDSPDASPPVDEPPKTGLTQSPNTFARNNGAPPPVDEPPKTRLAKLLTKFARQNKVRGIETLTQPERQYVCARAEAERSIDPQPATIPNEPPATDKWKQKEYKPNAAPAEDTRASIPSSKSAADRPTAPIVTHVQRFWSGLLSRRSSSSPSQQLINLRPRHDRHFWKSPVRIPLTEVAAALGQPSETPFKHRLPFRNPLYSIVLHCS
ncbi:hypothetical protein PAXINDRAFT_17601 [Paxillus involutus ATCC 200175]|uniref:Uncharacterized protein n=1 Tax=Paxillus involutus ATCC 200175 TaxID=664439 RepID=A0A0C9TN95_PAXIN|nr:hypothetical protein PAXINDRAFT_17601 [Paxillus involutus ATCC 200175]